MASSPQLRSGKPGDEPAIISLVVAGFDGYRAFASPGWEPPPPSDHAARSAGALEDPAAFTLVADAGGALVGVVQWVPATDEPDLLHVRYVFVAPSHWGTGLAVELHGRAVSAAREREWPAMRLYTPAQQARARRFYEREGWQLTREPYEEGRLGLEIVEYRLDLG